MQSRLLDRNKLTHEQIKQACPGGHQKGKDWETDCPVCGHSHLQLFGTDGFTCQNGCTAKDVAASVRLRLGIGQSHLSAKNPTPEECATATQTDLSISAYCDPRGLHPRVLALLFDVKEAQRFGKTVVAMPYFDEHGKLLATKFRFGPGSKIPYYFEPSDPHVPYGLNNSNLKDLVSRTYDLFICEGESDTHTLGSWGLLTIGISGKHGWLPEYADLPIIENARRIFVCEDQDEVQPNGMTSGQEFVASVLRDLPSALVFKPEGLKADGTAVKDVSDVHVKYKDFDDTTAWCEQHPFIQSIDIAIQAATLDKAMRQPKASKQKPSPMRAEAFYGLAGKIVRLLEPVLETDRPAILSNVLATLGVLFQHEAHARVISDMHYPVDYFLTVGNSAISRKGTTTNAVLELVDRVQPDFKSRILRGLSTGQGLINALIKRKPEGEEQDPNLPSEAIAESVLVEVSEFAELLAVVKRDENTLSAVLRDLWDGKPAAVLTRADPLKVQNVSLGQIAHITSTELLNKLTATDRANGFANRFLFIWSERIKLLPKGDSSHLNYSDVAIELHAALEAARGLGQVKRDSDAELLWAEEYKRLTTRGASMTDVLLNRADAHVVRLSLLYALLDKSRVIRHEHLLAALAFWDYCEESVRYVFGDAVDAIDEKIFKALEHGALTDGELRRRVFNDHRTAEWVEAKMAELERQRRVRRDTKDLKTKTVDAWSLIE